MLIKYLTNPSDYEVENDFIGEGNFGQVSLVHPKDNIDLKVALKKIPVDLEDKDIQKNFIREVSIMASLKHPNIIQLIGFSFPSSKDQTFQIYSKYLPNKTLADVLEEEEELNNTQLSIIVYGIASAMAYLHSKNIVHRDLKPENIFLDENFYPVLSDFGLSRFDGVNMTGRLGTPYFMAPELFAEEDEESNISNKIDVYAFAVTLLSLFTTNYKFVGVQPRTISQLINKVTSGKRYVIPNDVPKFYVNLIQKCWANDPNERPSFDEIVKELEQNDDFIFEGANVEIVKRYIRKTKEFLEVDKKNESSVFSSSTSSENETCSDDDYEDYIETKEFDFLCL